jgi:hypothetical protein
MIPGSHIAQALGSIGVEITRSLLFVSALLAFDSISWAQSAHPPCGSIDRKSPDFLHCVVDQIEKLEASGIPIGKAAVQPPLDDLLDELGHSLGYGGQQSDVDSLKSRSFALKQRDPRENWEAIGALDFAISSYVKELGFAVSTQNLASKRANAGKDIYKDFVRQKLDFLNSDARIFYDRGPFEITVRSLWANSLESEYFLDKAYGSGTTDISALRKEMEILDDIDKRYTDPQYDYLPRNNFLSLRNSNRFWRASLSLLVAGDANTAREILKNLVSENVQNGLQSHQGDIFVYKVYDRPYQILVEADGDVKNIDFYIVNRFYNPAQLALLACTFVDEKNAVDADAFEKEVREFVFNDYSVVVASAGEQNDRLTKLGDQLTQAIQGSQGLSGQLNEITGQINEESSHILQLMQSGAQQCAISNAVRMTIYAPFQFAPRIEIIKDNARPNLLLVGGHLNAIQARRVSDFINGALSAAPDLRSTLASLSGPKAFIARVPPQ